MSSYNLLKSTNGGEQLIYDSNKKELTLMSYGNCVIFKFEFNKYEIQNMINYLQLLYNNLTESELKTTIVISNENYSIILKYDYIEFQSNNVKLFIGTLMNLDILQQIIDELITKE